MNPLKAAFVSAFSQDVEATSPAALAGLQPHSDYIVGADQVLQDVRFILGLCNAACATHRDPMWCITYKFASSVVN